MSSLINVTKILIKNRKPINNLTASAPIKLPGTYSASKDAFYYISLDNQHQETNEYEIEEE